MKPFIYLDEYYSLKFPGAKIAVDEYLIDKKLKLLKYRGTRTGEFKRWHIKID